MRLAGTGWQSDRRNSIRFHHKVTVVMIALVLTATACGRVNDTSADSSPSNATDSDALVSVMPPAWSEGMTTVDVFMAEHFEGEELAE